MQMYRLRVQTSVLFCLIKFHWGFFKDSTDFFLKIYFRQFFRIYYRLRPMLRKLNNLEVIFHYSSTPPTPPTHPYAPTFL